MPPQDLTPLGENDIIHDVQHQCPKNSISHVYDPVMGEIDGINFFSFCHHCSRFFVSLLHGHKTAFCKYPVQMVCAQNLSLPLMSNHTPCTCALQIAFFYEFDLTLKNMPTFSRIM